MQILTQRTPHLRKRPNLSYHSVFKKIFQRVSNSSPHRLRVINSITDIETGEVIWFGGYQRKKK